ncbi:ABC transporter ATP-binding protein [Ramlibacter ginsenosidimutans]|uniref:ABC transporter ATP-binding protein n=2 Tax=Ramlibacter ginsenosidimutans TaxID=502333 RepID=A0A934TNL8_9BURK|nr:ABC transporter ATP-binding protein [Ramlibacter ginsenosidimutans]MBK6004587.1 ABC transporter ATP-binding protein [Ramlibacter ginsenosidimutans]
MSSDAIIEVAHVSKLYHIYDSPKQRLSQLFARGGRKHYREFAAIRDLSFRVERGQTVGVIGRNGAGKSTLLQMICGTLTPTDGEINVRGRVAALLELGAGFNPEFTGRENVYIASALYGLSRQQVDARFDRIVAFADIGAFIDQPVKTYSSGMFVRLAFAVIAHVDAEILVIDEALAVGDVFFQQKCMRFLRQFQANGGTMLFVSHDTSAIVNLCRTALWLKKPSTSEYVMGDSDEVCKAYLRDFYAQQVQEEPRAGDAAPDLAAPAPAQPGAVSFTPDTLQPSVVQISGFNAGGESFGRGGGRFVDACFVNARGQRIDTARAGEPVAVRLQVRIDQQVVYPAFGITIKDRLGQFIISESTDQAFRSSRVVFAAGDLVTVEFAFRMPELLQGHYMVDIAFAEGQGHDHVQHHWIHDAIALSSLNGRLVQGICGLPELSLRLARTPVGAELPA